LVLGAFRDRGSGGAADLGATARRVFEAARTSVLVVKGEGRLARMLVCVTDYATSMLDEALQYAQALDARVEVAYVAPPKGADQAQWLDTTGPNFGAVLEQDRQLAGAWQRIQARLNDRGVAAEALHIGYGNPVNAILQLTQQQPYDLLVTGVPGPGRTFADSFVDQLSRQSMQSVLVIRV
jgi:nucleotide-binding universal stress UspA family protein